MMMEDHESDEDEETIRKEVEMLLQSFDDDDDNNNIYENKDCQFNDNKFIASANNLTPIPGTMTPLNQTTPQPH